MKKIGDYYMGDDEFAKGAFSNIYIGYNKHSKKKVAIKEIIIQKNNSKKYIKREIEIHKKLKHYNVVLLLDIIYKSDRIYIIMEYCNNGSLSSFMNKRRMNEIYVQNFIYQLTEGLKYLRDLRISHRDLKPHNLLICNKTTLKISDFGLAKEYSEIDIDENLKQTYCGSPMYMSPEILNYNAYDTKSDLWSIGIIIYEMLTGKLPYKVKNLNQLMKLSKSPIKIPTELKIKISPECLDLLIKLLDVNKRTRISWEDYFSHPWLQSNHIVDYENNLLMKPLEPHIKLPEIFQIEDNISKFVFENKKKEEDNKKDENIDEETDDELYLSASSIFEEGIQVLEELTDSESTQSSMNLSHNSTNRYNLYPSTLSSSSESSNIDDNSNSNSNNSNNNSNNSNNSSNSNSNNISVKKMENSYVFVNNLKYTNKLESSAYESRIGDVEGNNQKIINIYAKNEQTQPIDIKGKKKYDFHNETNLVDINTHNSSPDSLQNNRTQDVRMFFQSSIETLKESYKYISNNNNSV